MLDESAGEEALRAEIARLKDLLGSIDDQLSAVRLGG